MSCPYDKAVAFSVWIHLWQFHTAREPKELWISFRLSPAFIKINFVYSLYG